MLIQGSRRLMSNLSKTNSVKLFCTCLMFVTVIFSGFGQAQDYEQYPQQPNYPSYNPQNQNDQDENHTAKNPFKVEIGRLEATVIRSGEEPMPLSQVTRLNKGDVLKVKMSNEPVNGIMPHQTNWDWTLLVAFINPSRNNASNETLSQEVRLREKGWYNDNHFTVPFDSQPMIFLYPKPKYRQKILELIAKKPDDVRQMGEKIIEISSAYGHISSFLRQAQYMLTNPMYNNNLLEQSIEGMARTFNIRMPNCWRSTGGYGYGGYSNYNYGNTGGYGDSYSNSSSSINNLAVRSQCLSRNIRVDDLNYSVGRMLEQGGLVALSQLKQAHPELSKWIALAAIAVDFILKLTRKSAIRIIPAVVSTPENPIYPQGNYFGGGNPYSNYRSSYGASSYMPSNPNQFAQPGGESKVSLFANYQPTDREFVTVYAYVPHKWQPEPEPKLTDIQPPQIVQPCLYSGKNILRNTDMRIEWLSDTFSRDFKLHLSNKTGWKKEFNMRKNTGLNAWEVDITKEEMAALPKENVFDAKITGKRGFTLIESPAFQIPVSNGGTFEASIEAMSKSKSQITVKRLSGNAKCDQNIVYKPAKGQSVIFPLAKENSFLKFTEDRNEITFQVDAPKYQALTDAIQIQQFGGETLNVAIKP